MNFNKTKLLIFLTIVGLTLFIVIGCSIKGNTDNNDIAKYELVKDWLQLPKRHSRPTQIIQVNSLNFITLTGIVFGNLNSSEQTGK